MEEAIKIVFLAAKLFFKIDVVQRQFGYMSNHDSNFEKLKTEVEMLKAAKDRAQRQADNARINNKEIDQNVEEWLKRVNKICDEAEELTKKEDKTKNNCCMGLCLINFMTCCELSKEASRMVDTAKLLRQEEEERDTASEVIWLTSTKDYEAFGSRNSILEKILKELGDPSANRIGLYGLPGVGKTTLVEEVWRRSKKDKLFDVVVFEEVTKTPDIKKLQKAIADNLGLESTKENERAGRLHARLNNDKKILIILDNIWPDLDLDLEIIGIPSKDNKGGCKVLLTTRELSVLDSMYAKPFHLGVLNPTEAWKLFIKRMGDDNIENRDLKTVANGIVDQCGGLPIAITTIASALRHKGKAVWKDVLQKLRRPSPSNFKGELAKAYSAIEVSYNNLEGKEQKKTFLLCSLMANHAYTLDLLKYSMGLDILQNIYTMEEGRERVDALVYKLKDSCLLLDSETKEWFSMHDFVREVAISIACRDEFVLTIRNEDKWEWPHNNKLEICTKISIRDSNISRLKRLECPKLEFFYMNTKDHHFVEIPENIFEGMRALKVIDFTRMKLPSLPSSIHLLKDLQTLCLDQCILGDIALIGNLKKLKILSFLSSTIEQLPREIGQLTKLRLLDLTNCSKLRVIAPKVLSSLTELEELYMSNTFIQWEVEGLNAEGSNSARLDELNHLSSLTTLEIHIKDDNILPKGLFSKTFVRYKICIGDEWDWFSENENSRMLKLKLNSTTFLDELQVIKNVEDLYLDELQAINNILYQLDEEGFPQLKNLHIQNNPHFLCIFDSMDMVPYDAFPLLESLYLTNLIKLEKIWRGQFTIRKSFCKLKIIKVEKCHELKNIFPFFIAKGLPQLETIEVDDCSNIEEVLRIGGGDDFNGNEEIFRQLRFLRLRSLPRFTSFCSKVETRSTSGNTLTNETLSSEIVLETELETPTSLFNEKVVLPNLEALELSEMNFEKIWHNQPPEILSSSLQKLTRLILYGCDNLKHIFSSSMVRNFMQLQHLEIVDCAVLEEVIAGDGEVGALAFVFPRVTSLELGLLPQLRTFSPPKHSSEWPLLRTLQVYKCDKVQIFQENNEISAQHSLFTVEKVNPDLEELTLSGKDAKIICQGQFTEHLFSRLKVLTIVDDESADSSFRILERFHNVEQLVLVNGSYEELFSYEEDRKHVERFKQIEFLQISNFPNLKHLCKQDSNRVDSTFQHLEILVVQTCENLINLVSSSASLKNLTELDVEHCNGLINLVTSTTAKSLGQLRYLTVNGCESMAEIVASEEDEEKGEIIFNKLQVLHLVELQSLESFCSSGKCNFKFPCLKFIIVEQCNNMKTFSEGVVNTPTFAKVYKDPNDKEGRWNEDLNTTIQMLYNEAKNASETSESYVDDEEEEEDGSSEE